jgi:hypothetical protein
MATLPTASSADLTIAAAGEATQRHVLEFCHYP